ncbi:DHHC palmitoyltransferase-domain-containing protein [Xylaria nigripes]|nr:DHHC palmitoyltransferase-domain-containing protein [Xylaria nigripes]
MAFLVGSTAPGLQRLAVPSVCILISVLGYGSQWLFETSPDLEPGPLTRTETRVFNCLLACLWWTYWRTCTVDPGRYEFPRSISTKLDKKKKKQAKSKKRGEDDISPDSGDEPGSDGDEAEVGDHIPNTLAIAARRRWCRKCAAPKPPRAHHCKSCGRCIPKMDHHCPWTGNCVSLQTFPHFVRFIIYTNISLWTLGYFLWQRFHAIWTARDLPAYLGPTATQMGVLTGLAFTTGMTAFMLGILLITTVKGWLFNTTMIEGWEIERHEAVLQRGGYEEDWWRTLDGDADNAPRSMVEPLEFPYDIGLYENMAQAMGTMNPIFWLLPFARAPRVAPLPSDIASEDLLAKLNGARGGGASLGAGWFYEENGLNDREGMWPPVDPEKVRNARLWRQRRREEMRYRQEQKLGLRNLALPAMGLSPEEEKAAFKQRQERDLLRWRGARSHIMDELEEVPKTDAVRHPAGTAYRPTQHVVVDEGKSGWVNADGEHLGDYGVDEDAEFDDVYIYEGTREGHAAKTHIIDNDDEEVPLAELRRRRKLRLKDDNGHSDS